MKKYLVIFAISLASTLQLNAQTKGDWGEVSLSFNNSLFLTSSDLHLNKQNLYRPYLALGLDVRVIKEWIAYLDMHIPFAHVKGLEGNINHFGELDAVNNLSVHKDTNVGNKREDGPQVNLGIGYRSYVKAWRLIPQIGLGMMDFDVATDYYQLKEMGTSSMYTAYYDIGGASDRMGTLYQLQFRFKAQRKLNRRFSLNMGVGYSLFLNRIEYRGRYSDYYTGDILETVSVKKRPHELSLSVGVGFR